MLDYECTVGGLLVALVSRTVHLDLSIQRYVRPRYEAALIHEGDYPLGDAARTYTDEGLRVGVMQSFIAEVAQQVLQGA